MVGPVPGGRRANGATGARAPSRRLPLRRRRPRVGGGGRRPGSGTGAAHGIQEPLFSHKTSPGGSEQCLRFPGRIRVPGVFNQIRDRGVALNCRPSQLPQFNTGWVAMSFSLLGARSNPGVGVGASATGKKTRNMDECLLSFFVH